MNSQVEARFRDADDARRKLVSFASGVGFRLLVKQALAPGEPLQIDIGDGNLLVLSRYRLPVEPAYSLAVERIDDRRPEDATIPSENAPAQDSSGQPGRAQRRGLVLAGIAGAIGLSALGIVWGGMRGVGHVSAPALASARQVARVETPEIKAANSVEPPPIALSAPQTTAHAGSTESPLADRNPTDQVSMPATFSKALPGRPMTHVKATAPNKVSGTDTGFAPPTPQVRAVAHTNSPAISLAGSAHSISIKASSASWVTACADGVKVFAKVFNNGDVGEVHFSREATLRSANAAALDLSVGSQSIGPMGPWGKGRTIKVTPDGYEFTTSTPTSSCSQTSPTN